jgi:hypothetical protein
MRKMSRLLWACAGLIVLLVAGCVTVPSQLEADYGHSYALAKASQILSLPDEDKRLKPVEGLDGPAAQRSFERYRQTFEKPPPPPAFTLSIGAAK